MWLNSNFNSIFTRHHQQAHQLMFWLRCNTWIWYRVHKVISIYYTHGIFFSQILVLVTPNWLKNPHRHKSLILPRISKSPLRQVDSLTDSPTPDVLVCDLNIFIYIFRVDKNWEILWSTTVHKEVYHENYQQIRPWTLNDSTKVALPLNLCYTPLIFPLANGCWNEKHFVPSRERYVGAACFPTSWAVAFLATSRMYGKLFLTSGGAFRAGAGVF